METDTSTAAALLLLLLPEDVLADVLRRLAPRGVAACRCVCKAWRALVDAHALLRADLLPRSLAGILVNFHGLYATELFSHPSTASRFSDDLVARFVELDEDLSRHLGYRPTGVVEDHCNGLLLINNMVVNPATRWCFHLPPSPPSPADVDYTYDVGHLVHDPTISPHYEVFLVPRLCPLFDDSENDSPVGPVAEQYSEWPPSPCVLRVFSSKTERWEERSFVREGKAAATIADMRLDFARSRHAAYWREALYVHCQTVFVMR